MTAITTFLLVLACVLVIALLYCWTSYNDFIHKRNRADQAFSAIDVMLKKRSDLVPNLVATVKEYMHHEADTLTRVTALRSRAVDPGLSETEHLAANRELGRAVRGIVLQVEKYPELKADGNFMHLQRSLNELEEQLSASRQIFNHAATDFNIALESFPGNVIAGFFRFVRRPLLETDEADRKNPDVAALFKA